MEATRLRGVEEDLMSTAPPLAAGPVLPRCQKTPPKMTDDAPGP
jgi:hypothetical protein